MKKKLNILLVEDSENDALLIIQNISQDGFEPVYERVDTPGAFEAALKSKDWDIILSDYNMPNFSGLDALEIFKKMNLEIPFIIISGTIGENKAVETIRRGADDYLMKDNLTRLISSIKRGLQETKIKTERQKALEELIKSEKRFKELTELSPAMIVEIDLEGKIILANHAVYEYTGYSVEDFHKGLYAGQLVIPEDRDRVQKNINKNNRQNSSEYTALRKDGKRYPVIVYRDNIYDDKNNRTGMRAVIVDISELKKAEKKLQKTLNSTINALASIVEIRDPYTAGHQKRVTFLAITISEELGLDKNKIENIGTGALIHDIGKITVPASILSKPGKISEIEFELIKKHPATGYNIIKNIEFPNSIKEIILQHHERLDGSGYPEGLKKKDIIFEAKILAVADMVEAMSSHRPYRPSLGIKKTLAEMEKGKKKLYDPKVVDACIKIINEKDFKF